jgi:hypothetical protein
MPKIIVLAPFKFAHHGHQVEEFEPSDEPRETTDECADLAVVEGWAEHAHDTSPETRDAAKQRKTKTASD